ncbi:MAG: D-alanyl-D-alanine carboxypeptidase [Erysipelotrichaceae bacterium]|nr:D-alanyl-D-alanine carboxypeptidase [Erysipelotrichaceae bacterium]
MKKILTVMLALVMSTAMMGWTIHGESKADIDLAKSAKGAYLMEYTSGKEIFKKNEKEKLFPASMTKMMGLLLIFEALNDNKLKWDDTVTTSELAASMGGSQVFLEVNETMSVKDMVKSICIASANDAMVAMAEKVGGTHDHFVQMMNDKANDLHLSNTHFVNTTGLHDPKHYSCAEDMAKIARALIQEGGDELLKITSTYDSYIREDSDKKFWLVNTNKLLKQKDNLRLISVVMGEPSSKVRNAETKQMLDYGFSQFSQGVLIPADTVIEKRKVANGKPKEVNLKTKNDLIYVFQKGSEPKEKSREIKITKENPPYQKGEVIATITIQMDDGYVIHEQLYADHGVEPLDYMDILMQSWNQSLF